MAFVVQRKSKYPQFTASLLRKQRIQAYLLFYFLVTGGVCLDKKRPHRSGLFVGHKEPVKFRGRTRLTPSGHKQDYRRLSTNGLRITFERRKILTAISFPPLPISDVLL